MIINSDKFYFSDGVMDLIAHDPTWATLISACAVRHLSGDWGELDAHDHRINDNAAVSGGRVLSRFTIGPDSTIIYVITEADRSLTSLILADEY